MIGRTVDWFGIRIFGPRFDQDGSVVQISIGSVSSSKFGPGSLFGRIIRLGFVRISNIVLTWIKLTFALNNQIVIPMTMNHCIFWVNFSQITIRKLILSPPQRRARDIKSI